VTPYESPVAVALGAGDRQERERRDAEALPVANAPGDRGAGAEGPTYIRTIGLYRGRRTWSRSKILLRARRQGVRTRGALGALPGVGAADAMRSSTWRSRSTILVDTTSSRGNRTGLTPGKTFEVERSSK
jgi:hypothetical protein